MTGDIFESNNPYKIKLTHPSFISEKKVDKSKEEVKQVARKTKAEKRKDNEPYLKNYFKSLIGREITRKELDEYYPLFDGGQKNVFTFSDDLIERDLKEMSEAAEVFDEEVG